MSFPKFGNNNTLSNAGLSSTEKAKSKVKGAQKENIKSKTKKMERVLLDEELS